MNATEIPEQQRGLGSCSGCRNRHMCSWVIDGRKYCGVCADKKRGVTNEPVTVITSDPGSVTEIFKNMDKDIKTFFGSSPFSVEPKKTYNVSIGQLDSGYILSIDGKNHVCKSKTDLINRIKGVVK